MDAQKLTFLQSLVIKDTELWQMRDGINHCRTRGYLQLLYSHKLDLYIMKLNDFSWVLEKSVHIIGTLSEKEGWNTYIIPSEHGFYSLKIISHDTPVIRNFETILANTTNFSLRIGLEDRLGVHLHEDKHNTFAEGLKKTWEAISRPFVHPHNEDHPNQLLLRSFDELRDLDSHSVPMYDISINEINALKEEAGLHQETPHWQEFRAQGQQFTRAEMSMNNQEHQRIAGTGLTSQSMGEEHLTRKTKLAQDQQHVVGKENQRLPSYEAEHVSAGLNKAFANLEGPTQANLKKEDTSLTTGLLSEANKNVMNIEKPIEQNLEAQKPRVEQKELGQENLMKHSVPYDI